MSLAGCQCPCRMPRSFVLSCCSLSASNAPLLHNVFFFFPCCGQGRSTCGGIRTPWTANGAEGTARSDWRAPPPLSVHHSDNEYLAAAIAAASLATTLFFARGLDSSRGRGDEERTTVLYYGSSPRQPFLPLLSLSPSRSVLIVRGLSPIPSPTDVAGKV